MRLMVVEDDRQIREGIRYGIEWDELGIQEVKDYPNGKAALNDFDSFMPDIILSDIRMPQMDGLELLKEVRKKSDKTRFVVLSAYSDFAYAQEALRYGANDYELKPIKVDQLLQVIQKQVKSLLERKTTIMPEAQLLELLENRDSSEEAVKLFVRLWEDRWGKGGPAGIFVVKARLGPGRKLEETERQIKEIAGHLGGLFYQKKEQKRECFVWILSCSVSDRRNYERRNEIKTSLEAFQASAGLNDTWISAGISKPHFTGEICMAYQEAETALTDCFYTGRGSVSLYHTTEKNVSDGPLCLEKLLRDILDAVKKMDRDKIVDGVDKVLKCMIRQRTKLSTIRDLFMETVHKATQDMDEYLSTEKMRMLWDNAEYIQEYGDALKEYLLEAVEYREKKRRLERFSPVVVDVVRYLEQNFAAPVTIEKIAETLDKSPNYLSSVFKKETGSSFTDYLLKLRMKEAQRLLKNTSLSIKEVAEQVGYGDYVYFSKLFKKTFGCSAGKIRTGSESKSDCK